MPRNERNGSTRSWRIIRAKVLREERTCRIQGPGCTHIADTVDHIVPVIHGGTDSRENLRGACIHCNSSRGDGTQRRRGKPDKPAAALGWFNTDDDQPPATLGA